MARPYNFACIHRTIVRRRVDADDVPICGGHGRRDLDTRPGMYLHFHYEEYTSNVVQMHCSSPSEGRRFFESLRLIALRRTDCGTYVAEIQC